MARKRRISVAGGFIDGATFGTWSDLIGMVMQNPHAWFIIPCPLSERRRTRASVVTTARRKGIKVTTAWRDEVGGLMWVREKPAAATAVSASAT